MTEEYMELMEEMMGGGLFYSLFSNIPSMLIELAAYVFMSLSLYTIANRRGIHKSWLAWVPVARLWVLGCISDQYRYLARREAKHHRRVLLFTRIAAWVLGVVILVAMLFVVGELIVVIFDSMDMTEDMFMQRLEGMTGLMPSMMTAVLLCIPFLVLQIIYLVYYYIALHDVYRSSDPSNALLFTLLGIFIGICQPIFLFVCRNKDDGMPPKEQPDPTPVQPYVYYSSDHESQPPQQPVEPWEKEAE